MQINVYGYVSVCVPICVWETADEASAFAWQMCVGGGGVGRTW